MVFKPIQTDSNRCRDTCVDRVIMGSGLSVVTIDYVAFVLASILVLGKSSSVGYPCLTMISFT